MGDVRGPAIPRADWVIQDLALAVRCPVAAQQYGGDPRRIARLRGKGPGDQTDADQVGVSGPAQN